MIGTEVRSWCSEDLEPVVRLLGEAFATNPLHRAIFSGRDDALYRVTTFFRIMVPVFRGEKAVAVQDGEVAGFAHWATYPACRLSVSQRLRLVPPFLFGLGAAAPRAARAFGTWARHDPEEPHVHLGPVGVAPDRQGRRVGTAILAAYCTHLDEEDLAGYLETDREERIGFYERFGFRVTGEATPLDVPTWFMRRDPGSAGEGPVPG